MEPQSSDLKRSLATGFAWTGWGKSSFVVVQLLVIMVLARMLTPEEFGIVGAAMIAIDSAEILAKLGLRPALIQRPTLGRSYESSSVALAIAGGGGTGLVIWAIAPAVAGVFGFPQVTDVLRVLAVVLPIRTIGNVADALLTRAHEFKWLAWTELVSYILGFGVGAIAAAAAGLGVWALVIGTVAMESLKALLRLVKRRPAAGRPRLAETRELLGFGVGVTVGRIPNSIADRADNFVVGVSLGSEALGVYGRAYQLMQVPGALFGKVLHQVFLPAVARLQGRREVLATAFRRGISASALVILPLSAFLGVLAADVVEFTLGDQWGDAVGPFRILAAAMLLRGGYQVGEALAVGTGAVYRRAWRQWVHAVLIVAGALVGQQWGLEGVAWGVFAALLTNYLLTAQLGLSIVGLTWSQFGSVHIPAARLAVLIGVVAAAVGIALEGLPAVVVLLLAFVVCCAVGLLAVWRMPRWFLGEEGLWGLGIFRNLWTSQRAGRKAHT